MLIDKLIPDSFEDVENVLKFIAICAAIGIISIILIIVFLFGYLISFIIGLL